MRLLCLNVFYLFLSLSHKLHCLNFKSSPKTNYTFINTNHTHINSSAKGAENEQIVLWDLMSNDDLKDIKSEKKIKIPYFVEYPTDKVVEEPDVTKEDLAKSILSELGFFSSNDSTPNTSVNTTPVTSSNTTVDIVDNSVENISSVHFESNLENSFDSNGNIHT